MSLSSNIQLFIKAVAFAAEKHRDQRRKDAQASPYINHPIALARLLAQEGGITDVDVLCAAVLHDTIEDTDTTAAELQEHFGQAITNIVLEVTDDKSQPKAVRKQRQIEHAAHATHEAKLVKLADKICNLRDILNSPPADWSDQRKREYFDWAAKVVQGLRGTHEALEQAFDALLQKQHPSHRFTPLHVLGSQLLERIEQGSGDFPSNQSSPTGFNTLDALLGGLYKGELTVIAGRPAMGKTTFALNIAEAIAQRKDTCVAIFSMDTNSVQMASRILAARCSIDNQRFRSGQLSEAEKQALNQALKTQSETPLFIHDVNCAISFDDLREYAYRLHHQHGPLGLILVDYLHLLYSSNSDDETLATQLGMMTRGLKNLAQELKCPVLVISPLNRSVECRLDKRPMMSDLRDSGAIEQYADVVLMIYRDDYYNKDSDEPNTAEIIIAKNRNGPTGTAKLAFKKSLSKFEDI